MQSVQGQPLRGPARAAGNQDRREDSDSSWSEEEEDEEDEHRDDDVRARDMAYDAYGRADALHREASADLNFEFRPVEDEEALEGDDDIDFANLLRECEEPVFHGSTQSRMQCGIVLLTLSTVFGVSDSFLTALLTYLAGTMLPKNNVLLRSSYELKRMVRRLGLEHQRIDSCPNGHILFEGEENAALTECPFCQHPRYLPGS